MPKITLTDREMGMICLALVKCDILSDMGVLPQPWCLDHDAEETSWVLLKLDMMRGVPDVR